MAIWQKIAYSQKGLSKYPLASFFLQFFLQISSNQSKFRIWIQISTPSQSQAPSKNLEEKLMKKRRSVYFHKPFWEEATFTNIQKIFLEKVDYRGCYSSIFKMGTALGNKGVATSILRPHPCHHHHFGTETWWSHPENLNLIA